MAIFNSFGKLPEGILMLWCNIKQKIHHLPNHHKCIWIGGVAFFPNLFYPHELMFDDVCFQRKERCATLGNTGWNCCVDSTGCYLFLFQGKSDAVSHTDINIYVSCQICSCPPQFREWFWFSLLQNSHNSGYHMVYTISTFLRQNHSKNCSSLQISDTCIYVCHVAPPKR